MATPAILKVLKSRFITVTKTTRCLEMGLMPNTNGVETPREVIRNNINIKEVSDELCRICLQEGRLPIFRKKSTESLADAINTIGGIEVSIHDSYPKYLCLRCRAVLLDAMQFRKIAQQSDKKLRNQTVITTEPEINGSVSDFNENSDNEASIAQQSDKKLRNPTVITIEPEINGSVSDFSENGDNEASIAQQSDKKLRNPTVITIEPEINGSVSDFNENSDNEASVEIVEQKHKIWKQLKKPKVKDMTEINDQINNTTKSSKIEFKKSNGSRNYDCKICEIQFNSRIECVKHKLSAEHKNKRVLCSICHKTYSSKSIRNHIKAHKLRNAYMCDVCGKTFKRNWDLNKHSEIHSNRLAYKCSFCPYKGRRSCDLKVHIRSHTGERPYQCEHCPQRCVTKSNLNKHMRTHKDKRNFKCEECTRAFRFKQELNIHFKAVHGGIEGLVCKYCNKVYDRQRDLMWHQRRTHKREKLRGGKKLIYLKIQQESNTINKT